MRKILAFIPFIAMVINVNVHEPAIAQYFPPDLCDVTNDGYYSIYTTMRNGWCMETYRFNSSTTGETIHIVRASTYTDNGHKISVVRGGSAYNNRQYSFHLYNENGRILSFKVNSELIVEEDSIEGDLALANNFISYFSYGLEQITSISLPTTGNPF